jgi:ribosomal protein S18 acetylase RimI-like enzyme
MASIRTIDAHDSERWRELFSDYGVFYETAFTPEVLDGVWAWLLDPTHPVSGLVATNEDGVVIGFAMYRAQPDTFTAGPALYLDDLFVDPSARGKGIASQMLGRLSDIAREQGATQVRWITAADNVSAQHAYNRVARKTSWVTYEMDVV